MCATAAAAASASAAAAIMMMTAICVVPILSNIVYWRWGAPHTVPQRKYTQQAFSTFDESNVKKKYFFSFRFTSSSDWHCYRTLASLVQFYFVVLFIFAIELNSIFNLIWKRRFLTGIFINYYWVRENPEKKKSRKTKTKNQMVLKIKERN